MNEPAAKQTILVAEDEVPMRKLLVGALQQAGYDVLEASNGKEALQIALERRPVLIVTDNVMPIMNGVDMVAEIRKDPEWGAKVPVILMTNVNDMESVNKAVQTGGIDYLMKVDIQLDQVAALVKQRLGGA